ncbi:MAG TPA: hypothetical protein VI168_12350 [Croceibacterium sp.]
MLSSSTPLLLSTAHILPGVAGGDGVPPGGGSVAAGFAELLDVLTAQTGSAIAAPASADAGAGPAPEALAAASGGKILPVVPAAGDEVAAAPPLTDLSIDLPAILPNATPANEGAVHSGGKDLPLVQPHSRGAAETPARPAAPADQGSVVRNAQARDERVVRGADAEALPIATVAVDRIVAREEDRIAAPVLTDATAREAASAGGKALPVDPSDPAQPTTTAVMTPSTPRDEAATTREPILRRERPADQQARVSEPTVRNDASASSPVPAPRSSALSPAAASIMPKVAAQPDPVTGEPVATRDSAYPARAMIRHSGKDLPLGQADPEQPAPGAEVRLAHRDDTVATQDRDPAPAVALAMTANLRVASLDTVGEESADRSDASAIAAAFEPASPAPQALFPKTESQPKTTIGEAAHWSVEPSHPRPLAVGIQTPTIAPASALQQGPVGPARDAQSVDARPAVAVSITVAAPTASFAQASSLASPVPHSVIGREERAPAVEASAQRPAAPHPHARAAAAASEPFRQAAKPAPDAQGAAIRSPLPAMAGPVAKVAGTEPVAAARPRAVRAADLPRIETPLPQHASASPVAQPDQPVVTVAGPAPFASASTPSSIEIDVALDRLVAAREALAPAEASLAIDHAEFGEVSIRFEQAPDGRLSAELAAADPELQRAVNAAVAADRNPASDGDGNRSAQQAGHRSATTGGDAAMGERSQPGNERDMPQRRAPSRPQARQAATDQRPGVFA